MIRAHCYVCNDAKKHRMKVNDLERITRCMQNFATEDINRDELDIRRNENLRKVMLNLDYDKPSVHYMCGHCVKVNSSDLDIAYNNLKDTYARLVVSLLKTDDEDYFTRVKYDLKRLFSGYLPRYARSLNLIVFNGFSKLEE